MLNLRLEPDRAARLLLMAARMARPRVLAFNPDQPRDEQGQWTDGGSNPLANEPIGEHTPAGQRKLISYLEKETDAKFEPHGSVGRGETSKNDFDIIVVPETEEESVRQQELAYQYESDLHDKVARGEMTERQMMEELYGDAPDPMTKALMKIGFEAESSVEFDMSPSGTSGQPEVGVQRYHNKKTGHSIEIWFSLRGLRAAAFKVQRSETPLHAIADSYVPKLSVTIRYAFAAARKAARTQDSAAKATAVAVVTLRAELKDVLPKVLRRMYVAGGELAAGGLKTLGDYEGHPFHGNQWTDGNSSDDVVSWHSKRFPRAGSEVDGRKVLDKMPNESSIESSLDDYEVLPGIREISMSEMDPSYQVKPYSTSEIERLDRLQSKIEQSKEISPLIIVVDKEKHPYILEGGHRFDVLRRMGAKSFPAKVVLDLESLRSLGEFRAAKREPKPTINFTFDAKTQAAIDWADRHAAELIDGISETSREAINNAVAEFLETGDWKDYRDEILAAVGDVDRADRIARNESMVAVHEGQREAWRQAVSLGYLPETAVREWIVVGDDKVCPICLGLEGKTAALGEEYEEGIEGPPAHVMCRCSESISSFESLAEWDEAEHPRDDSGKFSDSDENEDGDEEDTSSLATAAKVKAEKPKLAAIAQEVYDKWDENPDIYANGGICHLIADDIASHLGDKGIEAVTVSSDSEVHVWVAAKLQDGVYVIDIPPYVYETGGGYNWKKIPDVTIDESDVIVKRVSADPKDFKDYRSLKFNPDQPRDESGKWSDGGSIPSGVIEAIQQADGGFTYHPMTGAQPKTGYALSIHPDRERIIDAKDANVVQLVDYTIKNWDLLSQNNNYLGGWHNPTDGKVYLDISTVVDTPEAAEQLALDADQYAYFDLANGKSVTVASERTKHVKAAAQFNRFFSGTPDARGSYRAREAIDGTGAYGRGDRESEAGFERALGGPGSGNFGHAGRPGEVGGSAPDGSPEANSPEEAKRIIEEEQKKWLTPEEFDRLPPGIRAWKTRTRREKAEGKEPVAKKEEPKPEKKEETTGVIATKEREEAIKKRADEIYNTPRDKGGKPWMDAHEQARKEDEEKHGPIPPNALSKRSEAINARYEELRKEAREKNNELAAKGEPTIQIDGEKLYRQAQQEDAAKWGPYVHPEEVAAVLAKDKNWSPTQQLAERDTTPVEYLPRDTVEAKHLSPKQAEVQRVADSLAREMGFDPSLIVARDRTGDARTFELNGKKLTEGGHFNPQTGQIEINASYGVDRGVIVHEVQHAQWNYVKVQSEEEAAVLRARWAREQAADFTGTRYFLKNGKVMAKYRDQFEKELPHLSMIARAGLGNKELGIKHNFEALKADDGVSPYSKEYWIQAEKGGANKDVITYIGERAVDETLAEVSRRVRGYSESGDSIFSLPSRFLKLQKDVENFYKKDPDRVKRHFARRQKLRGIYKGK